MYKKISYNEIASYLKSIKNIKTKDLDIYSKELIKNKKDVSELKYYVLKDQLVHRIYFQVSLAYLNTIEEQLKFIEENKELLDDWWHVDQLIQFLRKKVCPKGSFINFDYVFNKTKEYINSPLPFFRRFGYVIYLCGLQKDKKHSEEILSLIKDDSEYYVQMAEAWLVADIGVFNIEAVKKFIEETNIDYNIIGKAIQKLSDSFRIKKEDKEYLKRLRNKKR